MKKIILDCDLMKHRNSGLYYYCLNLGNHVQNIIEKEQLGKMMFYVPPAEANTFHLSKSCIIEKNWHNKYFKPYLFNCDLLHAPFQTGRLIQKYNKRMKVVLTIHDLNVLHEDKPEKERSESLARTQELINSSDAIICISNHTKKDVLEHMNIAGKAIYVIHNGTHYIELPPDKPHAYIPRRPFVFAMGYVNRKKNFHTLLSLLCNPEIELVVAGRLDEPDYVEMMQQEAVRTGVSDRVKILGPVSDKDKAWYFKNSLAFALPSVAEGFGACVVEAMTFGKPVFLSHRTSLPEIGGDVAFYFSDFSPDHMLKVFNEGIREYQKNGLSDRLRHRAEQFNWEEKALDYVNVYRTLL
jgi:glycosyltransferase involved in cell wall biosynthesis